MSITLSALQKQRTDTAANWASANPTLLSGELGFESDTGKAKLGTGSTAWNSLGYLALIPSSGLYPLAQLLMPLGTAGAPSLTFTGDANTGIYSPGADKVGIATGGSPALVVDASQNVGIGAASPAFGVGSGLEIERAGSATLRIEDSASGSNFEIQNASGEISFNGYNTQPFVFTHNTSELVRIDSSGNVGIGTTSAEQPLHVETAGTGTAAGDNSAILIQSQANGRDCNIRLGDSVNASARIGYLSNNLYFYVNAQERARIDSSGRLLVGTSTATDNTRLDQKLGIVSNSGSSGGIRLTQNAGASQFTAPILDFRKTRGSTDGSHTIVADDDILGYITFGGADGNDNESQAAWIRCEVDGTPGTDDMPGRLVFSTTGDSASAPTERVKILANGFTKFTNSGSYVGTGTMYEFNSNQNDWNLICESSNSSMTASVITANAHRAASSSYALFRGYSGDFGDVEFNLVGSGTGYADGSWSGGGADYAEYFEWSDGNTAAEDRRGISVVLDGDKIREAIAGEEPIGVISGNPSVVGDAAWNKWAGKYLRDDFGTYIQEDYEVEDEDGNTVTQQRRKLNPDYNPDQEYVSREDRPEWDCVGLMGKLRIRKGQVTGSRWIKMRDISDTVEEWLVR